MPITIVATAGASNANSYVTLADADAYMATRFETAWTAAAGSDETRKKALVQATRQLDQLAWQGVKMSATQALEWPRDVQEEASDTIPPWLENACCEQALWILANSTTGGQDQRQELQAAGVTAYSIGGLSETFGAGRSGHVSVLCPDARRYASGWLRMGSALAGSRDEVGRGRPWWPFTEA